MRHRLISPGGSDSVWIENGALCVNFNQPVTLDSLKMAVTRGNQLRAESGNITTYMPVIVYLTNDGKKIHFGITDLGKTIMFRELARISAMIVVGVEGVSLEMAKLANKLFYSGQIIFCSTLDEALHAAEPFKNANLGIFEHDR